MDIVERLRDTSRRQETEDDVVNIIEAANEIERLRNGLEHIVEIYDHHVKTYDHVPSNVYLMAKIARETLKEKE